MAQGRMFRRKRYLIKKGFQFRYIGTMFLLATLASMVTGYTVFATGWGFLGEKLANVYPQGRLLYVFKTVNIALLKNLLFISPLIFLLGLFYSHKIAGPVYRIEKAIDEIAKGNLAMKIRLRRGDELWDLADIINAMVENISISMTLNKEAVLDIKKQLYEIKKSVFCEYGTFDLAVLKSSLNNLEFKVDEMSSSFDRWVTSSKPA